MVMSEKDFKKIVKEFSTLLVMDDDPGEALWFAAAVIGEEIDAQKRKCPYATVSIDRLIAAEHELCNLARGFENGEYSEEG